MLAAVGAVIVAVACGTDATGIEACRQIEEARCRRAPGCPVDMSVPVHRDTPKQDVEACIRYYHDACMHGLAVGDPGGPAVQACVAAIRDGDCNTLAHPESASACAFLQTAPPVDAGADGAVDGAPDAPAAPPDAGGSDAGGDDAADATTD